VEQGGRRGPRIAPGHGDVSIAAVDLDARLGEGPLEEAEQGPEDLQEVGVLAARLHELREAEEPLGHRLQLPRALDDRLEGSLHPSRVAREQTQLRLTENPGEKIVALV